MVFNIKNKQVKKQSLNSFETKKIEDEISRILYEPNPDQTDREILTIEIPREKERHLKFLTAYTKFKTQGVWKKIKDNNLQYEIEYRDSKDEKYGNRLMFLLKRLNKLKIGEKELYARTEDVDESTLDIGKQKTLLPRDNRKFAEEKALEEIGDKLTEETANPFKMLGEVMVGDEKKQKEVYEGKTKEVSTVHLDLLKEMGKR